MIGRRGDPPAISGVQIADIGGGTLMATIGILLALQARHQTNIGQYIDISLMDGAFSWLLGLVGTFLVDGINPKRGETTLTGKYAFYDVYETMDGMYITLGALEPHLWANFCRYIGKDELAALQFVDEKQEEVRKIVQEKFREKTKDEWVKIFEEEVDTCGGPVNDISKAVQDPQILYRKMIFEMETSKWGTIKQIASPIKMSETPAQARQAPPELGEHTEIILSQLGYTKEAICNLKKDGVI
jgi:crotonobetainyl-CoA:carnitine CoA-transferase CaiB-like acyl-CoA transferase